MQIARVLSELRITSIQVNLIEMNYVELFVIV